MKLVRPTPKQLGFSSIEALLIVLVVTVLAAIGYVVYQRHKSMSAKNSAVTVSTQKTGQQQNATSTQSQPATYLDIKEWGVRAPYSGPLNLQYSVALGDSHSVAVSSSQLGAGGPAVCSSTPNSDAGILSRYLPTDSNLGPKMPASETAEQYIEQNPTVPHAKVGNYIYIYWGNNYLTNGAYNGPCNDKIAAQQTIAAYSALVPKLQTIPPSTIKIPELGIQITVPDNIKDLRYKVSTVTLSNGRQATLALFSTASLIAIDQDCGTSFGPLGSLEKVNGQFPSDYQQNPNAYGQLVKQFPTFYISAGYPQAACTTKPAPQGEYKAEFGQAESTIKQID
jgi:Tfp pilus assembly protein PilV